VNADVQPRSSVSTRANVKQKRAVATRAAPPRSSRWAPGSRDSRTYSSVTNAPAMPNGTLTQKMADQSKALMSAPPRIGPPPEPRPATVAQIPIAHARRSGGNASAMIEREQRRPDSLECPERDQHAVARREGACGGEDREDDEAEHEDALAPVAIVERAAHEDERGERQDIRVDRPDKVDRRDVELPLDRGQRDVHDRDIEQDHELREAGCCERPALANSGHVVPMKNGRGASRQRRAPPLRRGAARLGRQRGSGRTRTGTACRTGIRWAPRSGSASRPSRSAPRSGAGACVKDRPLLGQVLARREPLGS
jgi:hypothetical protein